jgi:hypothetical protein
MSPQLDCDMDREQKILGGLSFINAHLQNAKHPWSIVSREYIVLEIQCQDTWSNVDILAF